MVGAGPANQANRMGQVCLCLPLLVLMLAASACAPAKANRQPPATATSTPAPYATGNPSPLSMTAAWGAVPYKSFSAALPDNYVFVFDEAATSDGKWLIGAESPREDLLKRTRPSYAVLYNWASGRSVVMQRLISPQSQILAASSDGDWVVWSEADDQAFADWALFAYNRQTGHVTQLAQAVRVGGKPVGGPYPWPVVSHDSVVWGQATGPSSSSDFSHYVVQLDDLTTGRVTTLATRAAWPAYSWPWVEWDQQTSGKTGVIEFDNLVSGQRLEMPQGQELVTIVGTSMAYADGHTATLIDDFTLARPQPRTVISVFDPDHVTFVTLSDRLVAWQEDSKTQVYDRVEQRIVQLPVHNGNLLSWTGGHLLLWADQESPAQSAKDPPGWSPVPTLQVLDTTTLPATPAA